MSTFALRATVQILLDQQRGQWLTVTDLCIATAADSARVRNVLQQLVDAGIAHMATGECVEHYGIGVEGVPPRFQTAHLRTTSPERTAP